ncbi:hypothetical protein BKA93DRAFT_735655, partial [Sparassis latifolia]
MAASPSTYTEGTLPHLPPETHDHILDYLQFDCAALKSCSLTCRAWLSTARHHLFRTISVS